MIIENSTIRKLGYSFVFTFHSNHGRIFIISDIMRDIGRQSQFFHTPRALDTL